MADSKVLKQQPLTLNDEQQQAYDYIHQQGNQCTVLDGITGSGKTEVYLQSWRTFYLKANKFSS